MLSDGPMTNLKGTAVDTGPGECAREVSDKSAAADSARVKHDVRRFCLPWNLKRYLELHHAHMSHWRLFLSMMPLGFQYSGSDGTDHWARVSGLSGDSVAMLRRTCSILDMKMNRIAVLNGAVPKASQDRLCEVDDYYLPYSLGYQKQHNVRYVVVEAVGRECLIFDALPRVLPLNVCREATTAAISLSFGRIPDEEEIDRRLSREIDRFLAETSSSRTAEIRRFAEDFAANGRSWRPTELEAVYLCLARPSGPVVTRSEMADSMRMLGRARGILCATTCCYLDELSRQWQLVSNHFFRLSRYWSARTAQIIGRRLSELIEREGRIP